MTPRGRPITISEDAILDHARDVFLARGIDATTAEIAERAGISESVIFYRYKTKEALFFAVFERQIALPSAFEQLAARAGRGDIGETLFDAGSAQIELMKQVLPFMMMAFSSPTRLTQLYDRAMRAKPILVRMIRLLSGYFEAEIRLGRMRPVDTEILARLFLGGIRQYVMTEFLEPDSGVPPLAASTYLRNMIDVLLRGSLAGQRPTPPRHFTTRHAQERAPRPAGPASPASPARRR